MAIYKGSVNKSYSTSLAKRVKKLQDEAATQALVNQGKEQGKTTQGGDTRKFVSKVFDQLNTNDNARTFKQGTAQNNKNSAEQTGDVARSLLGTTAKGVNTAAEATRSIIELERATAGQVTGNKKARDAALRRGNDKKHSLLERGRGILGEGGLVDTNTAQNLDTKDLLKTSVSGGAGIASEILPGARGFSGATRGARLLQAGAEGAVLGGVGDAASQATDNNPDFSLKRVAESAAIGAAGGLLGNVGGTKYRNGKKTAQNAPTDLTGPNTAGDIPAGPQTDESRLLNARNSEPVRPLSEIDKEIQDLQTNGVVNGDTAEIRDRFNALQQERQVAVQNESTTGFTSQTDFARQNFENNGLPNTPDEAQKALDEFNANPPDSVHKQADLVQSLDDVRANPAIPQELKDAANQVADERKNVITQMNSLMSPQRKQSETVSLNERYQHELDDINKMPEPQRSRELQTLDEDYHAAYDELDAQELQDAPQVDELVQKLNDLQVGEQHIVMDTRNMMKSAPDNFRTIDPEAHAAQLQALQDNLDQAHRFNRPADMNADTAEPVVARAATESPTSEDFAAKIDENQTVSKAVTETNEDASKMFADNTGTPGVGSYLLSAPLDVFKKWGGAVGDELHSIFSEANYQLSRHRGEFINQARVWDKAIKDANLNSEDIIKYVENPYGNVSPEVERVGNEIKSYLTDMAQLNGLPEEARIQDYFPHLFEQTYGKKLEDVDKIVQQIRHGVDDNGNKLSSEQLDKLAGKLNNVDAQTLQYIRDNSNYKLKNGFLEKRTGADNFSKDLIHVLNTYDYVGSRKAIMEPAMTRANELSVNLGEGQKKYLNQLFDVIKGQKRTVLEESGDKILNKVFKTDNATAKVLRGFRRLSNLGTMGGSVTTVLKQFQQLANVGADLSIGDFGHGIVKATTALKFDSPAQRELYSAGVMDNSFSSFLRTGKTTGGKVANKVEDALWKGMQMADTYSRGVAYFGAKDAHLAKFPDDIEGAIRAGREASKKTNFEFSDFDIPLALNNEIGRSTIQMQTFNIQQAKYVAEKFRGADVNSMFQKTKDGYRLNPRGAAALLKLGVGTTVFFGTIGTALGMDPAELVPFGSEVKNGQVPQSPIVSLIAGNKNKVGLLGIGKDISGIAFGDREASQAQLAKDATSFGTNTAKSMIPGATQANRSITGYKTATTGSSKDAKGNVKFLQDTNLPDQVRATLFGQYSTPAGRRWIDEKFPTLTDAQMRLGQSEKDAAKSGVTMDTMSRPNQEVVYDYYAATKAAPGRQKAYDAIKQAARSGNIRQASRLANEYNDNLNTALGEFWKKHQDIPKPLEDDLTSRYIKVNDVIDNL
jgi:hypothetical protein